MFLHCRIGLAHIGRVGSVFVTVSVTIERYYSVCRPTSEFRFKWLLIPLPIICAFMYNIPKFFELEMDPPDIEKVEALFCVDEANKYFPSEIPFKKFDVAVFPNRWSSFNTHDKIINIPSVNTKPALGHCEVIVYSSGHFDTVAEMSNDQIELLTKAWIDRYQNLLARDDIFYVMPFENRGQECGVTLDHPHGQIYCYPFVPPVIQKEIDAFKKKIL